MGRRKKIVQPDVLDGPEAEKQKLEYTEYVLTDPKYSEIVDADNKYNMSDDMKAFVYMYVETKSLGLTCQSIGMDIQTGMKMLAAYSVQQEIKRLTLAKLQRRTMTKIWDYSMLESYLTSFLTDEHVPLAEQLKGRDKVAVVKMIMDVKDKRALLHQSPEDVVDISVDEELKNLSVEAIEMLLKQDDANAKKKQLIEKLKTDYGFSDEDENFIKTLSLDELLKLIDSQEK